MPNEVKSTREQREAAVRCLYGSEGVQRHAGWIAEEDENVRDELVADARRDLLVCYGVAELLATRESSALAAAREAAVGEAERLRGLIKRDRTGLAKALDEIVAIVNGCAWVAEGRGCYTWDDDRYTAEAGDALRAVRDCAEKALRTSGDLVTLALFPDPTRDVALRTRPAPGEAFTMRRPCECDGFWQLGEWVHDAHYCKAAPAPPARREAGEGGGGND